MSSITPKFKDCLYESDKHPANLRSWITLIGNLVRNLPNGDPIEKFLDNFLERQPSSNATKPAFLSEPRLQIHRPEDTDEASTANATETGEDGEPEGDPGTAPTQAADLGTADNPTEYYQLSEQSKHLDQVLYNTLSTIVTGTMLRTIQGLRGENARYSFAIIAMWQYADLSASNRRLIAVNSMNELQFNGDPGKWTSNSPITGEAHELELEIRPGTRRVIRILTRWRKSHTGEQR